MPSPKWLLLAPPCVWALVGLIALFAPGDLVRLFPILWPLHDVALLMAGIGALWLLFRGPGPVGPVRDEWEAPASGSEAAGNSLEALLVDLARALEAESRAVTSASRP